MFEHVFAKRLRGVGEIRPFRLARQAQIPARGRGCVDGKAGIAEQGTQRGQQRIPIFGAYTERIAVSEQARAVDVRPDVHRIGAQPGRAGGIARIGLAGERGDRPMPGRRREMAQQLRSPAGRLGARWRMRGTTIVRSG